MAKRRPYVVMSENRSGPVSARAVAFATPREAADYAADLFADPNVKSVKITHVAADDGGQASAAAA